MKIAIIGAGNMGAAIVRALVYGQFDAEIAVANPSTGKLEELAGELPGIVVTTDNAEAAAGADIVVIAVKPWVLPAVAGELRGVIDYDSQAVVSIAGGVGLDDLERLFEKNGVNPCVPAIYHVIPDTAIAVGAGMTFISSRHDNQRFASEVVRIFESMGRVAEVEERLMGAATALSSCGIAYVYKFIQAYVQAGVEMGFRPADALRYTIATIDGATAMLDHWQTLPQQEIDRVTTPGGMTIKGINSLEHSGFTSDVIKAILAPLAIS